MVIAATIGRFLQLHLPPCDVCNDHICASHGNSSSITFNHGLKDSQLGHIYSNNALFLLLYHFRFVKIPSVESRCWQSLLKWMPRCLHNPNCRGSWYAEDTLAASRYFQVHYQFWVVCSLLSVSLPSNS